MRVIDKARFSQRACKRRNESDTGGTEEPRTKRTSKKNESEHKVDKYCWICHTEADDEACHTCHRVYHNNCLNKTSSSFNEQGACPECQTKSVSGTELTSNKYYNVDKLKRMLDVLIRRCFDKKPGRNEKFLRWPEKDRDKLFKIIDFAILRDNINHVLPYTKTAEFFSDVKCLYHNAFIVYGANSEDTRAAENLRRYFKSELLDLEACPECYYHLYCDESDQDAFVRLCDSPHDIVWAQLTGYPYWPAKCLNVVKGIAHVRFFGKHEQSNIPINKCYFISESHPKDKNSRLSSLTNSGPKSQHYKSANSELLKYIHLYRRKYGDFQFYPHKTHYKPHEKVKEANILSTEGIANRNVVQMKLEGIVNEDSEVNLINAATVMEFSEDSLTTDLASPNESFKELHLKSFYPEGNEKLVGQYSTLDEIIPSVDATSLATEPVEGNLNTNASAVTSINMTFSTDENHLNVEHANPVASSLGSLPSITSTSRTETVHDSGILSSSAANDVSNDSSVQIETLNNIGHDFSIYAENNSEVDNDVHYLGENKIVEDDFFNPEIILPIIEQGNPLFTSAVQNARYLSEAMIIHVWANLFKQTGNMGALSKLTVELRKNKTKVDALETEKNELMDQIDQMKDIIQQHENTNQKLNTMINNLKTKICLEKEKNIEAASNAKTIIRSLKSGCSKQIEEVLKTKYMGIIKKQEENITRTVQELQNAKNVVKKLEEENKQLKEEHANVIKNNQHANETVRKYKTLHYCCVCEQVATFVCCLNASYCSSECQAMHAGTHRKFCEKNHGGIYTQKTHSETTVYVHQSQGVITAGRASTIRSTNSETSSSHTLTSLTHHKKAEIKRVAAAPLSPSSPDNSPGPSSRYQPSKSRRRYH